MKPVKGLLPGLPPLTPTQGELGAGLPQLYSGVVALFEAMRGRSLLPSSVELESKGPAYLSLGNIQAPPTPSPTTGY